MKANRADLASTTQREEEIRKMTQAAGGELQFFYATTRSLTYFILDHHHCTHTFTGIKQDDQTAGKLDFEIMRYKDMGDDGGTRTTLYYHAKLNAHTSLPIIFI